MHYIVCDLKKGMTKKIYYILLKAPPPLSFLYGFLSPFPLITTIYNCNTTITTKTNPLHTKHNTHIKQVNKINAQTNK